MTVTDLARARAAHPCQARLVLPGDHRPPGPGATRRELLDYAVIAYAASIGVVTDEIDQAIADGRLTVAPPKPGEDEDRWRHADDHEWSFEDLDAETVAAYRWVNRD